MNDFLTLQVAVPAERIGEFHTMLGEWLSHTNRTQNTSEPLTDRESPRWFHRNSADAMKELDRAWEFYESVSNVSQVFIRFLATHPSEWFSTGFLAEQFGLDSAQVLAGSLKSIGVYSKRLDLEIPYETERTPEGSQYWMDDDLAGLFRAAIVRGQDLRDLQMNSSWIAQDLADFELYWFQRVRDLGEGAWSAPRWWLSVEEFYREIWRRSGLKNSAWDPNDSSNFGRLYWESIKNNTPIDAIRDQTQFPKESKEGTD